MSARVRYAVVGLGHTDTTNEDCLRSGQVGAVYIALPNNLHRRYAVTAARYGGTYSVRSRWQ